MWVNLRAGSTHDCFEGGVRVLTCRHFFFEFAGALYSWDDGGASQGVRPLRRHRGAQGPHPPRISKIPPPLVLFCVLVESSQFSCAHSLLNLFIRRDPSITVPVAQSVNVHTTLIHVFTITQARSLTLSDMHHTTGAQDGDFPAVSGRWPQVSRGSRGPHGVCDKVRRDLRPQQRGY